jgi:hypothetical protein
VWALVALLIVVGALTGLVVMSRRRAQQIEQDRLDHDHALMDATGGWAAGAGYGPLGAPPAGFEGSAPPRDYPPSGVAGMGGLISGYRLEDQGPAAGAPVAERPMYQDYAGAAEAEPATAPVPRAWIDEGPTSRIPVVGPDEAGPTVGAAGVGAADQAALGGSNESQARPPADGGQPTQAWSQPDEGGDATQAWSQPAEDVEGTQAWPQSPEGAEETQAPPEDDKRA